MDETTSIADLVLPLLYLPFIIGLATLTYRRNIAKYDYYKFYKNGLWIKIFGALLFVLVYLYYYGGGDTINYFKSARTFANLLIEDPSKFAEFYFNTPETDVGYFFNDRIGYPVYPLIDHNATFTCKFYTPIVLIAGNSIICATIISAWLSFTGMWRLFIVFQEEFPKYKKELAIALFFIPSVFFWGSGILKDSITISSIGWFVYGFYYFFIQKRRKLRYLVFIIIAAFFMLNIKPYILFALIPGCIIWVSNNYAARFEKPVLKRLFTPIALCVGLVAAFLILNQFDELLGLYKVDTVFERAVTVNKDLQMDYYGGKSFNIGDYEPTVAGMLSVSHKAIFAALFRPTLLDVQNIVMLLSALENTILLILTIQLLIQLRVIGFFRMIGANPLILFSIMFALFFAFSVGVSISNFGSLVRLRIPALPFFAACLLIIRKMHMERKQLVAETRTIKPEVINSTKSTQ